MGNPPKVCSFPPENTYPSVEGCLHPAASRELNSKIGRVDSPCVMISIQNMYVCVYIYIILYIYYIIYIRLPSGIPPAIGDVKWGV